MGTTKRRKLVRVDEGFSYLRLLVASSRKVWQNVENKILGLGKGRILDMYLSCIIIGAILQGRKDRGDVSIERVGTEVSKLFCALEP